MSSLDDRLLSSRIHLPPEPCVAYTRLAPLQPDNALLSFELARRSLLATNESAPLVHSLLSSISVTQSARMYVFAVSTQSRITDAISRLDSLQFDGLAPEDTCFFALKDIYTCSAACSHRCLQSHSPAPREIYSHFLEAVRIRLLDDVAHAASQAQPPRPVRRLKGGFLLGSPPSTSEWGSSWEYRALSRPLLYCQLQIHLSNHPIPSLIVHPLLLPTHFLPLAYSLPLPPGTPITLLPHGTPAFFLALYSGPTSALTRQFQESLSGLGVSGWDAPSASAQPYIIAWINVENKQGEDKGLLLIYPTALCLSSIPSLSTRPPLHYIPDLPAPLQPSPYVSTSAANPIPPSPSITAPAQLQSQPILPSSPTSDSISAFRALTLSKSKDIRQIAAEVAEYVDAVARDRERERERLRRERERDNTHAGGSSHSRSPKLTRTTVPAVSASATTSTSSSLPPPAPAPSQPVAQPPSTITPTQTQQSFYPSPPQTNPPIPIPLRTSASAEPTVASTSTAALDTTSASTVPTPLPLPLPTSEPISAPQTSFDAPSDADAAWAQPYLDIDLNMDIDFDMMDMDMDMGFRSGGRGIGGMDFDDAAFTDDDFSFFDRPSTLSASSGGARGLGLAPTAATTHMQAQTQTQVPQTPASVLPQQIPTPHPHPHSSSPWGNTPGYPNSHHLNTDSSPNPPLLPPSPGPTPPSAAASPAPLTPFAPLALAPAVHLQSLASAGGTFDPIPFAAYHRALDGKYAVGKFALPSPPEEEDEHPDGWWGLGAAHNEDTNTGIDSHTHTATSSSNGSGNDHRGRGGWRAKYMAATDPRIGVVRKLIGVKRKMDFAQGGRRAKSCSGSSSGSGSGSNFAFGSTAATTTPTTTTKAKTTMSPSWIREHEDWEKNATRTRSTPGAAAVDEEDEEEEESDGDMDAASSITSPAISRPSTPPPSYLPPGPSLLPTYFHHAELLPLSTPLRPLGSAPTHHLTGPMPALSVPTPASPAAVLGAAAEKSKSLEAAAYTVASEVVENPPWAEAWRASTLAGARKPAEVWLADVRWIGRVFGAVPGLEGPLDLGSLFGFGDGAAAEEGGVAKPPLRVMEAPMIAIGKGDAVIQVLPTALRFWEKLGLGPRGGKKNGTAFVLFEDGTEERQEQVEAWLSTVATTYEGMHLGTLVPGKSPSNPRAGVHPVRFDSSFRKSLGKCFQCPPNHQCPNIIITTASLMANLPASQSSLIFFIVTPIATLTLASPVLRQVFSAVKKALKTYSEAQIHFQFIPEQLIHGNIGNPASVFSDLELLCGSIYNRILVPVDRVMSRRFFEFGERVRKYFQEPVLTLARPVYNKVSFVRAPHASLDVMDRNTFLHVGYQVSPCGKWILAACIDQRGEAHDLGVWLTQSPGEGESEEVSDETFLVSKIWDFAVQFAKKANVEWRIVFSRLGTMAEGELEAWATWIEAKSRAVRMASVTILSVESEAPWTFCSTQPQPKSPPSKVPNPTRSASTSKNHPQNIFTDISTIIYAVSPYSTLPQSRPPTFADLGLSLSLVPEPPCPSTPSSLPGQDQRPPSPSLPHPLSFLPRSSTTLICIPATPSPTAISMLHIHLLHTARPPSSPATQEDIPSLHSAITRNFHELAVLAGTRWRLGVSPMLPFHLAAVEAMRIALARDQYALDSADGA
ncbi:hypothetical protein D9615_008048 [Tricholomella constricta]|uniref:Mediator of RNA polymerase II transcription subunit 13 n=1 Tax=Tricholomella constricta TaxID=117010 RepID=A0A8H5GVG4_9AGAR|nr:hypothetical protein D9615_008048 [Tricholomella constricta]